MRRALVTGGSGFGGSHLIRRLLWEGVEVWNFDVRSPNTTCANYIGGDVRDRDLVQAVLRTNDIDTVFHLAAQPLVPLSIIEPFETLDVNSRGTYSVLDACRTVGVDALVVASSGAYYGTTTTDQPIPETAAPLAAANLYAAGKAAADLAAQGYAHTYDLPVGVCRFMNTYGPGDTNESRLIPHALQLLRNDLPYDFGSRDDGTTRLDFLHIDDMISAYLAVAKFVRTNGGHDAVFNIGTGSATSTAEVARALSCCFDGRERTPIFSGADRAVPVVKYLDVAKARAVLGWSAGVDLRNGLRQVVAQSYVRCS
jgi:nucleoside-diphosphate-sugar epimerase